MVHTSVLGVYGDDDSNAGVRGGQTLCQLDYILTPTFQNLLRLISEVERMTLENVLLHLRRDTAW